MNARKSCLLIQWMIKIQIQKTAFLKATIKFQKEYFLYAVINAYYIVIIPTNVVTK